MGVAPRDGTVGVGIPFHERDVITTDQPLLLIEHFRATPDVDATAGKGVRPPLSAYPLAH